jgi:FkbM family methyltransferase
MPRLKEAIRQLLPRSPRLHTVLAGPLRGVPLCTSWHDYPGALLGTTERPLLDWFATHVTPGETWLDVGAHYGYTSLALARLTGLSGRVFAFEPVAATAACLERTRAANNLAHLHIVPFALSNSPAAATLHLPETRGMADSTLTTAASGHAIRHQSLDTLWPSLHRGRPEIHGIKIDVQGMEGEALAGMRGILAVHLPLLVVEFHNGVDRNLILDLLRQCRYSPSAVPIAPQASPAIADNASYAFFPARS